MTNDQVHVPLFIVGADDVPIVFSNLMLIQHEQQEFMLSFCQYSPPMTLGPPEAQLEQMKAMPYVPVKVVARVGFTPQRMHELIGILQDNYNKWEKKQKGG
ncbi:MAG: DUF3467 domain-containing protein [Dehalococcoidia bacterium]|nr:DUF3467 domain-containing protein [Dehalococcoidia bacterium]